MVTIWSSSQARRECGTLVESTRVRIEQVSGSSPLVGSLLYARTAKTRRRKDSISYPHHRQRALYFDALILVALGRIILWHHEAWHGRKRLRWSSSERKMPQDKRPIMRVRCT